MKKLLKHYENSGDPHENRTNSDMETVCFVENQFLTELFASASFSCSLRLCLERRVHWSVFKINADWQTALASSTGIALRISLPRLTMSMRTQLIHRKDGDDDDEEEEKPAAKARSSANAKLSVPGNKTKSGGGSHETVCARRESVSLCDKK
jgi:hypothetical protein